jgi:uncharacterized protein
MSDLKFNVAQLLREPIGGRREYDFTIEALPLDEQLRVDAVTGAVRFTRSGSGVVARVRARGSVRLTCVRSLETFDEPVAVDFTDEFHSVIDVNTGASLPAPEEDDPFFLSDTHMADIGEAIREYVLLELPMSPVAPAYRDTPVSYSVGEAAEEIAPSEDPSAEPVDARLAALKNWRQE